MLRSRFSPFALIAVVTSLAISGCATTGAVSDNDEDVAATQEAASEEARGPGFGPGFHHGPPRGHELLFVALHELELTAEQRKTIEASLAELGEKDHGQMEAMGKILANGVRAGKVDEAAVSAKAEETSQQEGGHRAAMAKALNTLHATLTPAQREELVAGIEEHMKNRPQFGGPKGERHGKGKGHGPKGMGERHHGPMGFFLHDLNLTDEQGEKIHAALEASRPDKPKQEEMAAKHEEMRAKQKVVLEAFRTATFDAAASMPEKPAAPPVLHLVKALNVVVPVLDANQRETLAKKLEEGPSRFEGRHEGGRHEGKRHGGPGRNHEAPAR